MKNTYNLEAALGYFNNKKQFFVILRGIKSMSQNEKLEYEGIC